MKKIPPQSCCTLNLSLEDEKKLQSMSQALGNPLRFEILKFLVTHPGCITGDIVEMLPISQSTTSQHLKVLKESGWIDGVIEGTKTCYCLDQERTSWFKARIQEIF